MVSMPASTRVLARNDLLLAAGGALVLVAVVWAIYGRALGAPFIYDDPTCIADNPSIVRLWPPWGDADHPGPLNPPKDRPTAGRPLVNLTLALNYHFGGLDPVGYHAFNLAVHCLAALCLGLIVQLALQLDYFEGRFAKASGPLALLTALLWAVHPLNTETVVYVTQRTELMFGLFYLVTLYGSLRYWGATSPRGRGVWLVLATLACWAGMACKEVMVTAPVIVLLFQWMFVAGSLRQALRQSWPLYIGLALGWAVLLGLNYNAPRGASAGFHLAVSPVTWWFTQAEVVWIYLKLAVWPWPLLIHYHLPYLDTLAQAWPWLLTSALLLIAVIVLFWRRQAAGFVGAWVLLILSPTFVVPIVTEVAAERRMYLPLAAIEPLVVAGGYWLAQRATGRAAAGRAGPRSSGKAPLAAICAAAAVVAIVYFGVDVQRLDAYGSPLALWQENTRSQPDDSVSHNNLGFALLTGNQPREAIDQFREALRLDPNYNTAHSNLGAAFIRIGQPHQAIEELQSALRSDPNDAPIHCNLGIALGMAGRIDEAILQLQQAVRINPNYALGHSNLGYAYSKVDRLQDAAKQYQLAIKLRSKEAAFYFSLAVLYAQMNRPDDALATGEEALKLAKSQGQGTLQQNIKVWLQNYQAGH
jgi:tetratricopeptide (TPR) repeat protein